MNVRNVFAEPARRLIVCVCRSKRAASLEAAAKTWMQPRESGSFIPAEIARPGVDRFFRCRAEWAAQGRMSAMLVDPVPNQQLKSELQEQFGIETAATDFGLNDLEFECGDEVILVIPRRLKNAPRAGNQFASCYGVRAVRFCCPSCAARYSDRLPNIASLFEQLGRDATSGNPDLGMLQALLGGSMPTREPEPVIRIEIPVRAVLRMIGGLLAGLNERPETGESESEE